MLRTRCGALNDVSVVQAACDVDADVMGSVRETSAAERIGTTSPAPLH